MPTVQTDRLTRISAALLRAAGASEEEAEFDTPETIRANYQYFTQARMDRLRKAGYAKPPTGLEDGIKHYVQDFLMRSDRYR